MHDGELLSGAARRRIRKGQGLRPFAHNSRRVRSLRRTRRLHANPSKSSLATAPLAATREWLPARNPAANIADCALKWPSQGLKGMFLRIGRRTEGMEAAPAPLRDHGPMGTSSAFESEVLFGAAKPWSRPQAWMR